LVVFESFLSDLIGHIKDRTDAKEFCSALDRFVYAIIDSIKKDTTVVITSDHGNLEDLSIGTHTHNPAVLIVYGSAASKFSEVRSIVEVPGAIQEILGI
jgi:bisphosphoglycerate-independent phosphoglycerate mutase (AlkP superfamily)